MKVVIRSDGSSAIGLGHVMRSLALAQALRDGDDDVTLVTAGNLGAVFAQWEREGATVRSLDAEIGSSEDASLTTGIAQQVGAAWLVVDGYAFDHAYRSALGQEPRLLLLDDHGAARLRATLIVNGNFFARAAMYPSVGASLLLGPRYAMLRREFRDAVRPERDGPIVLSLGGADPEQRTAPLLEALSARGLRGRVVIGPHQRARAGLRTLATSLGWEPVEAPSSMATLLASAEMAIVGSGTTTLECAALGVPMVAVPIAANQAPVAAALEELGLAAVGDGDNPEGVAEAAAALAADAPRRTAMADAGPHLVDGRGALRVASSMREALLSLRPATRADARLLHDWRNDLVTRASSFTTAPVPWEDHVAWLDRALAPSSDTRLLVGELDGSPVGVVRLQRAGVSATISVTVAPEARSRGLAAPIIRAAMRAARDLDLERVEAYIRPENIASRRAFSAAGFIDATHRAGGDDLPEAVLMVASTLRPR